MTLGECPMDDETKRERDAERVKRLMPYLLGISGIMLAAITLVLLTKS